MHQLLKVYMQRRPYSLERYSQEWKGDLPLSVINSAQVR